MNGAVARLEPQQTDWSARDYVVLIVAVAASLCLLAIVGGTLYFVGNGTVDASDLGKVEGIGKGTGLLGLLSLIVYIIAKLVSPQEKRERQQQGSLWRKKVIAPVLGLATTVGVGFISSTAASHLKQEMAETQRLRTEEKALKTEISDLVRSREDVLAFLATLSRKENLQLVDKKVDWPAITSGIAALPAGQRKRTVYGALLLAWKDVPLNLKGGTLQSGVTSPGFLKKVFDSVDLPIALRGDERLSDAMKRQFKKVETPKIGDLLFYKGPETTAVGNFVMMYLGPGDKEGHGVCLGTFERGNPVQVIDSYYFDRVPPYDKFVGFYEPTYQN